MGCGGRWELRWGIQQRTCCFRAQTSWGQGHHCQELCQNSWWLLLLFFFFLLKPWNVFLIFSFIFNSITWVFQTCGLPIPQYCFWEQAGNRINKTVPCASLQSVLLQKLQNWHDHTFPWVAPWFWGSFSSNTLVGVFFVFFFPSASNVSVFPNHPTGLFASCWTLIIKATEIITATGINQGRS